MGYVERLKELGLDTDLIDELAMLVYTLNKISGGRDRLSDDDILEKMYKYKSMLEGWIEFLENRKIK